MGRSQTLFARLQALVMSVVVSFAILASAPEAGGAGRAVRIAFVTSRAGEMQIATVLSDGTNFRVLTRGLGMSHSPRWSPDGRTIVYTSTRSGSWQIYTMNADGSRQRRLTAAPGDHLFPVWSPDSRRILYVARRGEDEQIHVMNADGSAPTRLTGPPGRNTVPVWSPDGRMIAFVSTRDGMPHLYLMHGDGTGTRRLTAPERIISNPFGQGEKQSVSIGGLLLQPGSLHPAWSPDSGRIAFAVYIGRAEQQVSVVDIRSGAVRRFATGYAPQWSPEGSRVAFVVARVGSAQIYVAESGDPTDLKRLTPAGVNLLPAWSPDGNWIAFLGTGPGGLGVYVMRPDGSGRRRLADAAGDLSMLPVIAWQPR